MKVKFCTPAMLLNFGLFAHQLHALSSLSPLSSPGKIKEIKVDINSSTNINKTQNHNLNRRKSLQKILFGTLAITTTTNPLPSSAVTDEGISAITDSSIGRTFRKSAIQGARVIDNLDEKWERFSDSLRDQNRCDENTGRRLYDNGFRKDGTRIGNPVLGNLCKPEPLKPFDRNVAESVIEGALVAAISCGVAGGDRAILQKSIVEVEDLVRASFERTIRPDMSNDERDRIIYNFSIYSRMRAIQNCLRDPASIRKFQLAWGQKMVAILAPYANRSDYSSPFPEMKDEFEDYDYDKDKLLDALGTLKVAFDTMKNAGIIGYSEISIPYDDYGSVVTVAIDDYVPIGAEMLLAEQNYSIAGPAQALLRWIMVDKGQVNYNLDTFYIDPSTTQQSVYNPSQLLLSLNNVRKQ